MGSAHASPRNAANVKRQHCPHIEAEGRMIEGEAFRESIIFVKATWEDLEIKWCTDHNKRLHVNIAMRSSGHKYSKRKCLYRSSHGVMRIMFRFYTSKVAHVMPRYSAQIFLNYHEAYMRVLRSHRSIGVPFKYVSKQYEQLEFKIVLWTLIVTIDNRATS